MSNILQEIIEIKLQMIKVFEKQIEILNKREVKKLKDFQIVEHELLNSLQKRREIIKKNREIISSCTDDKIIEQLKDVCIIFEKTLTKKHQLIENAMFVNGKILDYVDRAFKEANKSEIYKSNGNLLNDRSEVAFINREA